MLNSEGNPYRNRGPSRLGDNLTRLLQRDLRAQRSAQLFAAALQSGTQKFSENIDRYRSKELGYTIIDVGELRKWGVQPINH